MYRLCFAGSFLIALASSIPLDKRVAQAQARSEAGSWLELQETSRLSPPEAFPYSFSFLMRDNSASSLITDLSFDSAKSTCECRQYSLDITQLQSLEQAAGTKYFDFFFNQFTAQLQGKNGPAVQELKDTYKQLKFNTRNQDIDYHTIGSGERLLPRLVASMAALAPTVYFDVPDLQRTIIASKCMEDAQSMKKCCMNPNPKNCDWDPPAPAEGVGLHTMEFPSGAYTLSNTKDLRIEDVTFTSTKDCKCSKYTLGLSQLKTLQGSRGEQAFNLFHDAWVAETKKRQTAALASLEQRLPLLDKEAKEAKAIYEVYKFTDRSLTTQEQNNFAVKAVLFGLTGPVGPLFATLAKPAIDKSAKTLVETVWKTAKAQVNAQNGITGLTTCTSMYLEKVFKEAAEAARDANVNLATNGVEYFASNPDFMTNVLSDLSPEESVGKKAVDFAISQAATQGATQIATLVGAGVAGGVVGSLAGSTLDAYKLMNKALAREDQVNAKRVLMQQADASKAALVAQIAAEKQRLETKKQKMKALKFALPSNFGLDIDERLIGTENALSAVVDQMTKDGDEVGVSDAFFDCARCQEAEATLERQTRGGHI